MAVDKLIWKMIMDITIVSCVAFVLLAVSLWADPFHRGYFEDDHSLRLPYKEQTISEAVLACSGFAFILGTVILVELFRDRKGNGVGQKFLSNTLLPGWVWETYTTMGIFIFGALCQQLTTAIGKRVIGRLRPFFFDVCRPVPNATSPLNALGYIQDYSCAGTNENPLRQMRLSFPSAHASFAMYAAVFFVLYIQVKGKWRGSKLLRHGMQYFVFVAAWYVGLSRVVENLHHWSDVAAGFLIGAGYAVFTFVYILKPKKYGAPHSHQMQPAVTSLPRPATAR